MGKRIKSSTLAVGVVSFIPQFPVLFTKRVTEVLDGEDSSSKKHYDLHGMICCPEEDLDLWISKAKVDRTMSVPGSLVALYQIVRTTEAWRVFGSEKSEPMRLCAELVSPLKTLSWVTMLRASSASV